MLRYSSVNYCYHSYFLWTVKCIFTHPFLGVLPVATSTGGGAVQKKLGRTESIVAEIGCVAAVSESCKIVAEQRAGFLRELPPAQGFVVKVEGRFHALCFSLEMTPFVTVVSTAVCKDCGLRCDLSPASFGILSAFSLQPRRED